MVFKRDETLKRTTIFADEEMLNSRREIAQQDGISVAELIRQALERFIAERPGAKRLPSFLGIGAGGRRDIAKRSEELLWKGIPGNRKTSADVSRSC